MPTYHQWVLLDTFKLCSWSKSEERKGTSPRIHPFFPSPLKGDCLLIVLLLILKLPQTNHAADQFALLWHLGSSGMYGEPLAISYVSTTFVPLIGLLQV